MWIYYFIFFSIMLLSAFDISKPATRNVVMFAVCFVLIVFVAFRGEAGGDGWNYINSWNVTPTIYSDDWSMPTLLAYSEPTYYAFTFVLKSICENPIFYFAVVAALSLSLIFTSLRKYSIYPMVGLLVYMSRFFILRDFNQIRAAIAIALIIYATQYIATRNTRKFLICWLVAMCFHISMIIVLPFYFLNKIKLTRQHIYIILAIVFVLSIVLNSVFKDIFDTISMLTGKLSAYTGDSEMAIGSGMFNPMIYFQLGILVLYTMAEDRLKDKQLYYYTIRNGFLFSTVILMFFSSMLVIGARLSTVFATYEIFIIPALLYTFNVRSKVIIVPILYVIFTVLYIVNLSRAGELLTYGNFII